MTSITPRMRMYFYSALPFAFALIACLLISAAGNHDYEINWNKDADAPWLGKEVWSMPLQDWQLRNHRVECLVSKTSRSFRLNSYEIQAENALPFEMSLDIGAIDAARLLTDDPIAAAGLLLGIKGEFAPYQSALTFPEAKHLKIGISLDKKLFIRDTSQAVLVPKLDFGKGFRIRVSAKPSSSKSIELAVSIHDLETDKTLGGIQKPVKKKYLSGLIGAFVNFPKRDHHWDKERVPSFWFDNFKLSGPGIKRHKGRTLGPIMFAMHSIDRDKLNMSVQMAPINLAKHDSLKFQLRANSGRWLTIKKSKIDTFTRMATFSFEKWPTAFDTRYRIVYDGARDADQMYGSIQQEPSGALRLAALSCNDYYGFPHNDISKNLPMHHPDLYFFAGDQLYETDRFGVPRHDTPLHLLMLDYLRKWYLFGWAYKDMLANTPSIVIPDDHDVFQPNLWGNGGSSTPDIMLDSRAPRDGAFALSAGAASIYWERTGKQYPFPLQKDKVKIANSGGYMMPIAFVNAVEQTQTGHLPRPHSNEVLGEGLTTYYTDLNFAGISFAILEDRKFKSTLTGVSKRVNMEEIKKANEYDKDGLKLLGEQQLSFLEDWSQDWSDQTWMKVALSQSLFSCIETAPVSKESPRVLSKGKFPEHTPYRSFDSNGWPQSGRNKAIAKMRKAFALHVTGDQHLGSTLQYGIEEWQDAGYVVSTPAISNLYPRLWWPPPILKEIPDQDPKVTGNFHDGFNNKVTVKAVYNPYITGWKPARLYDRGAGYAIVDFDKESRDIMINMWPRQGDPSQPNAKQCEGWPIKINQQDNYNTTAKFFLPRIKVIGLKKPVLQVIDQESNETCFTLRLKDSEYQPKVPTEGLYTIRVGDGEQDWKTKSNISSSLQHKDQELLINF